MRKWLTRCNRALLLRIFDEDTPLFNTFYPGPKLGKEDSNGATDKANGNVHENSAQVDNASEPAQTLTPNHKVTADGSPEPIHDT